MADFVRVTPAEGRLVRDPSGNRIPDAGAVLDRSRMLVYLTRLERNGDVTITEAAEPSPIPGPMPAPVAGPAPAPVEE